MVFDRAHLCAHCRAPLPRSRSSSSDDHYCCGGCRAARALLSEAGLDRYYELATGTGTPGTDAPPELPWLPAHLDAARALSPDPRRVAVTFDVQGLHCAACIWLLRSLFSRHPGAHHLAVNPGVGRLTATIDPDAFPLAAWLAELARVGYRAGPPRRAASAPSDGLGLRLGITTAIAMNGMALALAGYFGLDAADDPDHLHALFGWVNLALSTVAVFVAAPVFFRGAWHAIANRSLHLDVPIALGIALAWLGSVALFLSGRPDLAFFDTLEIFLALMLLGRWVQRRFLDRSRRLLLEDDGLEGARVKLVDAGGHVTLRPLGELVAGQRFLVTPGELVPVAAALADMPDRPAAVDLAWINGEHEPRAFAGDAVVPAGAHLVGASARVLSAREPFSASALHDLLARDPARDDAALPSGDRFWHHLALAWVVTVLAFAAITAIAWWSTDPLAALTHATAVLVVTCPCAIGLATPLAHELAQLRLRKKALLPRRPDLLERARHLRHVVFDKTGTLTLTEPRLENPAALAALDTDSATLLAQLAARSNHPKSRALAAALPPARLDARLLVEELPGVGLHATAGDTGYTLVGDGRDLVFSRDSRELARFHFDETLRPDAAAEVARLHDAGLQVHIASGDAAPNVRRIAERLRIPPERAHAQLSPAGKAALVAALGARETLVLGDGINDALAFEAAAVSGTPAIDRPILPARADFVLLGSSLGPLAELVAVARQTHRITRRNAAIAGVYNVLALAAGLAGWLSPIVAAVAMPLSSVAVIALTLSAQRPPSTRRLSSRKGAPQWMPST